MRHLTNGDLAAAVIRRIAPGEVIPWRDVLHEGPVRAGLTLDELSAERAAFIAETGWGDHAGVLASFRERDARLQAVEGETVLWFEHDLYDQLQLIQVLDWFAAHPVARLSLICEPEYLGRMKDERAAQLFAARKPVTPRQLDVAEAAWLAFRSPHPAPLVTFTVLRINENVVCPCFQVLRRSATPARWAQYCQARCVSGESGL